MANGSGPWGSSGGPSQFGPFKLTWTKRRLRLSESRYTLRQLGQLARAYWVSSEKRKARNLTAGLAALTLAQVGLAIWLNYWNRALFDALDQRSLPELLRQVGVFVVLFGLTMVVTGMHLMVKRALQLNWRQWLTHKLVGNWMSKGKHYRLLYTPGEHDNPDGRIAEDIRIATEVAVALGHTLLFSVVILGSFIDILWRVSGTASVPGTSVAVPGYLVVLAFVYAGVGTLLGGLLGRPLIQSTNRLQTAEADFRFGLAQSRENSEAIAVLHGEETERRQSARRFAAVASGWNRQSLAYLWIVSFSTGYGTLLPIFPILVAAPQYIAGAMSLGVLMQAAQAFQRLTQALSWPIDSLGDIARCRASADRVLSLYRDLEELEANAAIPAEHRITVREGKERSIVLRNLCLRNAEGKVLLDGFNGEIRAGERVLITGDTTLTVGLFKVLAGVWPWGSGEVTYPANERMEFLPQRPYLPKGTLREVLSYPYSADEFGTREMRHALERSGLSTLVARLDEIDSWDRVLTLRMQQRLAFARIVLHRPSWIFMEQATDTLEAADESALMETLHRELPKATVVTVSFHPVLERHHTRKIVLTHAAPEKEKMLVPVN
jgi:putative ATP-binding cassette transporter